jgi:hypothetical protein
VSFDAPVEDVMQGVWRIYSGMTWHNTNKKKKRAISTPSRKSLPAHFGKSHASTTVTAISVLLRSAMGQTLICGYRKLIH